MRDARERLQLAERRMDHSLNVSLSLFLSAPLSQIERKVREKFDSFISLLQRRNTKDFIITDADGEKTRRGGRRDEGEDQSGGKLFRGEIHAAMQIFVSRGFEREGICI